MNLALPEIILLSLFFIVLTISTAYDRNDSHSAPFKWWVIFIGTIIIGFAFFAHDIITFSGIWESIKGWAFWENVLWYLGLGLAYACVIEFIHSLRGDAKQFKRKWKACLNEPLSSSIPGLYINTKDAEDLRKLVGKQTVWEGFEDDKSAKEKDALEPLLQYVVSHFINTARGSLVELVVEKGSHTPQPKIKKTELAECLFTWTFLWPAYAVSLLLGDFLVEVFHLISEVVVKLSNKLVKDLFKDVFSLGGN